MPQWARWAAMRATARRSHSTKVTWEAPRLNASIPTAPVPANPSRTRLPSMRGASTLNNVSRSRSDVGRSPSHVGDCSRRPLSVPPTILIRRVPLPDAHQPEPLFPLGPYEAGQRGRLLRIVEGDDRFAPRRLHDLVIAYEIAEAERRHTGLPGAEEISGTAKFEIALRDFEPVACIRQCLQPRPALFGQRGLIQQNAIGLVRPAADAAAQLVQLRKTEAFRMLDQHDRRIRYVDPDFDHPCPARKI